MEDILFFDTDETLYQFCQKHPIPNTRNIYFSESLSNISNSKIKPYSNARIISIFTHSTLLDNSKLKSFKNLSLISTRSTGVNHIDLKYCHQRGICVSNVPQYGAKTVAEFAFALLLNLSRKIKTANNDICHNIIQMPLYTGFDLAGKTIGIIGTGSIGQHMIHIAKGFDMKILTYDIFHQSKFKKYYVDNLSELYQKADIISLHIPSTKKNYHLLNRQAFQQMKNGVIIINTARGDLIDSYALYQSLIHKKVAAVGLDVLENEDYLLHDEAETSLLFKQDNQLLLTSTINLKLMQLNNVIITPHIAFNTIDAIQRINTVTRQNIQSFLLNQPINLQ